MIAGRPRDYRDVIHPRRLDTRVFLVANTQPCIDLRDAAARPTGRDYRITDLGAWRDQAVPPSWVLAAILCPGDDTQELVHWLATQNGDAERVVFFMHPDTDPVAALEAWYGAGHGDPVVHEAATWIDLARPLGQFVNDLIYLDAVGQGWPL